jgi:hypothetical protein
MPWLAREIFGERFTFMPPHPFATQFLTRCQVMAGWRNHRDLGAIFSERVLDFEQSMCAFQHLN